MQTVNAGGKKTCSEHEVNLTSRSPEGEERATTDAASTEAARAHEPFISTAGTKRSREPKRNDCLIRRSDSVGNAKLMKPDECSPDLDSLACVGFPRMKAMLNLFSSFFYIYTYTRIIILAFFPWVLKESHHFPSTKIKSN